MRIGYNQKAKRKTIFLILFFFSAYSYSANKIGFVDMDKLLDSSPQISNARALITSEFESQYTDIEQKETDLERLENRITKDGAMMSLADLKPLQERARILDRQIRRAKEDLKDAISIRKNQILSKIQDDLNKTVEQYAKDNGYDAILINAILYVSDEMNITDEILKILKEKDKNEN